MAYKAQREASNLESSIVIVGSPGFIAAFLSKDLWFLNHFNSYKWMLSEKTRLNKGKIYWTDVFFFSSRMWYTANSTDSESVDLIMKSIIFSFEPSIIFFRSSNSVDDKLVSVVKKEELWGRIVKKLVIRPFTCLRNSRFYQWIVFSELPNSV
jgi:hypothetical protein